MTNYSRVLYLGYVLFGDPAFKQTALFNMDYMLGDNPLGISWTTGLGTVYPINIQHAVSNDDGIPDPVPGITIFGINGGTSYYVTHELWSGKKLDGSLISFIHPKNKAVPLWRRWMCHPYNDPGQNEFTIYQTISPTMFTAAMLMSEDWMPNDALKNKQPTPLQDLTGYWYLP